MTFEWLPSLVISVMVAIACLALIVGLYLIFASPHYDPAGNEFRNFVEFYNGFLESDLKSLDFRLFLPEGYFIVGFGNKSVKVSITLPGVPVLSEELKPCTNCFCLYQFFPEEKKIKEISCDSVDRMIGGSNNYPLFLLNNSGFSYFISPHSLSAGDNPLIFSSNEGRSFVIKKILVCERISFVDPSDTQKVLSGDLVDLAGKCLGRKVGSSVNGGVCVRLDSKGLGYSENDVVCSLSVS